MKIRTYLLFRIFGLNVFLFIPGSIRPVRFWAAGTVPTEISIPAVTNISLLSKVKRKETELERIM